MRHPRDFWTTARQDTMKIMAEDGFSAGVIAAALNCSRNAVIGRARRQGISLHGRGAGFTLNPRKTFAEGPTLANVLGAYRSPARPAHALDVTFAELDEAGRDCRYVYGEGAGKLFCGQLAVRGTSYCRECHEITSMKIKVDANELLTV